MKLLSTTHHYRQCVSLTCMLNMCLYYIYEEALLPSKSQCLPILRLH